MVKRKKEVKKEVCLSYLPDDNGKCIMRGSFCSMLISRPIVDHLGIYICPHKEEILERLKRRKDMKEKWLKELK